MKIIPQLKNDCIDKTNIEQVEQQKQELKLLGTYFRTTGMFLYCYNPNNDKIEQVELKRSKNCILVVLEDGLEVQDYERPKIEVDPNYHYFEKSNMKNAIKHVQKFKDGVISEIFNLRTPSENKMHLI